MLKRKSVALLIQGSALMALFLITVIGAREAWTAMTMQLVLAAICFSRAVKERRAEVEADRRRTGSRPASDGLS